MICNHCTRNLPDAAFYRRTGTDKPMAKCKDCRRSYQRTRRLEPAADAPARGEVMAAVIADLKANPNSVPAEIAARVGCSASWAQRVISKHLRTKQLAYISGWGRSTGTSGGFRIKYTYGPGRDAPKPPRVSNADVVRLHKARKDPAKAQARLTLAGQLGL